MGTSATARNLPIAKESPGVSQGKDLAMARLMYGSIDLGGHDRAMAKKVLDIAYVDALLKEEGRDRVPEHVGGDVEFQAGLVGMSSEHGADRLLGEATAKAIMEKVRMGGCGT